MKLKSLVKLMSVSLFAIMLFQCAILSTSAAVSYRGKGTVSDPYLIENAEQLQGMRNNLSSCYKLANTIDLTGKDFKPIGRLDAPFTGSFLCELNADKTPKYVIKNLSVKIAETAYISEKKSKWEAGLFGALDGATISGIYVLDANVVNNVYGDNTGAVQYGNYKPGMDEMAAGVLAAFATNSTISSCGVSGKSGGRANHCGGLIGRSENDTIENCYSKVNVKTDGLWTAGGFIANAKGSTIKSCFSEGNVSGHAYIGSFIGMVKSESQISDCYASGDILSKGSPFATTAPASSGSMKNCIAMGKCPTYESSAMVSNTTNCWVLNGTHEKFTTGDMNAIKNAFSGLADWDVSGSAPKLKNVAVVADSSVYKPGTVSNSSQGSGASGSSSTSGGSITSSGSTTTDSSTEVVDASEIIKLIEALPDPDKEGALTVKDKDAVIKAYKEFNKLDIDGQDSIDTKLVAKLNKARYNMSYFIVADLIKAIKALPDTDKLTADDLDKITELWDEYEFLDDSVKPMITDDVVEKLKKNNDFAKNNARQLNTNTTEHISTKLTTTEWIIVIAGSVIILISIAFNVLAGIWFVKNRKKA